jgi:purine-nucleoside phosphorylase
MYQREDSSYVYHSDLSLNKKIKDNFSENKNIYEGNLVTVQAMLAETKEDVDFWNKKGYLGVDMESATVFAVSSHFNVPSAALLYVADNLVKGDLVTDDAFQSLKVLRAEVKKENYIVALKTIWK